MDKLKNTKPNKDFYKIYSKEIYSILNEFETERKKINLENYFDFTLNLALTYIGLSLFIIPALISNLGKSNYPILLLLLLYPITLFIMWKIKNKDYTNKTKAFVSVLKKRCFIPILKKFKNIKWSRNVDLISDSLLNESKLFTLFVDKITDDEFEGCYKNISFKVSEMHLALGECVDIEKRGSGKIFNGVILLFSLDKEFKAHTMVSTRRDLTSRNNAEIKSILTFIFIYVCLCVILLDIGFKYFFESNIVIFISSILMAIKIFYSEKETINSEGMEKINLEDVKFNKKFDVYSQDQIEGRCYVTPAFMERFVNLNTAFGAKKAKCAFFQNQIMFAISTKKNLFEIGSINKSLLDFNTFENFYKEINAIYEMIDYFKLETKS